MANEQIKQNFKDIANAIRSKTGENGTMTAEEMPSKIESIETGIEPSGSLDITANGNNIDVTTKATVNVNVPTFPEPSGTITLTENNSIENIKNYEYASVEININAKTNGEYAEELAQLLFSKDRTFYSTSPYLTDHSYNIDLSIPAIEMYPVITYESGSASKRFSTLPGFYDVSSGSMYSGKCIIIGAIIDPTDVRFDSQTPWGLTLSYTISGYSATDEEQVELEETWIGFFQNDDVKVIDLNGNTVGYICHSDSTIHAEYRTDS